MKLQWMFLWLGLAVMVMLACFHLYLHETRLIGQVRREVDRIEQWKKTGVEWVPPVITGQEYNGAEMAFRRLNSVGLTINKHDDNTSLNAEELRDLLPAEGATEIEKGVEAEVREEDEKVDTERRKEEEDIEKMVEEEEEGDMTGEVMWGEIEEESPSIGLVKGTQNKAPTFTSQTSFENQTDRFFLPSSFSLPTPEATLSLTQLVKCPWMSELKDYLTSIERGARLVSLVSSDYKYREVLLNWLLTAQVKVDKPLNNVLVLSLDKSLHTLLTGKMIPCVHIPTSCLLRQSLKLKRHIAFTQVHIMRVLVMRLLSYWGYDVANYDSDALILRNPEPRYEELADRHLIGSVGHFPKQMDKNWGTAVCIGVVMIRASPQTELYWQAMSRVIPDNTNDQARLNWALEAMNMKWKNPHCDMTEDTMMGEGREGFTAAVLPVRDVCRQTCSKRKIRHYYIWHKGGAQNRDGKMSYASKGGLWYLHSNWEQTSKQSASTGIAWLRQIGR